MYSELEMMVAEDMLNEGYNPENELDIEDYWSYYLPEDEVNTIYHEIMKMVGYR